jgi:glycosyltransferase involved in cell wall biosynthesis
MRIVLATGIYPPDTGGAATAALGIIQEAKQAGISYDIVCYGRTASDIHEVRINHPLRAVRYFKFLWSLNSLVKSSEDIVMCTDIISAGLPALILRFFRRFHLCIRFGGEKHWENMAIKMNNPPTLSEFWGRGDTFVSMLYRYNYRLFFWLADVVIVNSVFLKSALNRITPLPESKTRVVENIAQLTCLDEKIRSNATLPDKDHRLKIVYVGRFLKWKNLEMLIDVLLELEANGAYFQFDVYGEGDQRMLYQDKVKASGAIRIREPVAPEDVRTILKQYDVFVMPSVTETYSFAALEALCENIPVLITSEGGLNTGLNGVVRINPKNPEEWRSVLLGLMSSSSDLAMLKQEINIGSIIKREGRRTVLQTVMEVLKK